MKRDTILKQLEDFGRTSTRDTTERDLREEWELFRQLGKWPLPVGLSNRKAAVWRRLHELENQKEKTT